MKLIIVFAAAALCIACVAEAQQMVQRFHLTEFAFESDTSHDNPFMVEMTALFSGPGGVEMRVPAFYDGDGTWKVRFSPNAVGEWRFTTESGDAKLAGRAGAIVCVENADSNVHGRVRIDPQHARHFIREDGARYFMLGFESDWIWALDMGDPKLPNLTRYVDAIARSGFNMVVTNAYAHDCPWAKGKSSEWDYGPPAMYAWEGTNDRPDHSRLNLAYWQHYDRVIELLASRGIVAHIMLRVYNKMVNWPENGSPEDWMFYRNIIARYGAFDNIIWDFSKEAHNEKDLQYKLEVLRRVKAWDAFGNLITVHDDSGAYDAGRYDVCDFRSDQQHSNWGEVIRKQRAQREWPVMNIEYGYERGAEELPTYGVAQDWREVLRRTYEVISAGGYATYYYSNCAWDLIKWDPEPPGWPRYRILRDFFERTRYWEMEPNSDVVDRGWCLALPGKQYIVFLDAGDAVTLKIEGATGKLPAAWLDVETGEEYAAGKVGNGSTRLEKPEGIRGPGVLSVGGAAGPAERHDSRE